MTLAERAQEHLDAERDQDVSHVEGLAAPPADGEQAEDQDLSHAQSSADDQPRPPLPNYYEEFEFHVAEARKLLWQRINLGTFRDSQNAEALMDAYSGLGKALKIVSRQMMQLPLPGMEWRGK